MAIYEIAAHVNRTSNQGQTSFAETNHEFLKFIKQISQCLGRQQQRGSG